MRNIAIMNLKGGTAKTVTAATMARCLSAEHGKQVLLIDADQQGNLSTKGGEYLATLGVYTFEDNAALERTPYGLFTGDGAQVNEDVTIYHKWVERSNVDMTDVMVSMITTQRALQSAAEILKIYDQVISKDTTEIGRM